MFSDWRGLHMYVPTCFFYPREIWTLERERCTYQAPSCKGLVMTPKVFQFSSTMLIYLSRGDDNKVNIRVAERSLTPTEEHTPMPRTPWKYNQPWNPRGCHRQKDVLML